MALKGLRQQRGRQGLPFLGSALIHAALIAGAWATTKLQPEPMIFESYAIELVSPPPSVLAEQFTPGQQELIVEKPPEMPDPAPPAPKPEPDKPAVTTPAPRPEPKPPAPTTPPAPAPTDAPRQPAAGPDAVAGSPGGENLNVRMEGLRRDYPAYYNTIVTQITRCFNQLRSGRNISGAFETTVDFVINRDGKIRPEDIRVFRASGNRTFDFMAEGAVECAGTKLDPLPADLPYAQLPIRFKFTPAGAGGH